MYQVLLLDLKTNKQFWKDFQTFKSYNSFVNKVRRGKQLKILQILDNTKYYD